MINKMCFEGTCVTVDQDIAYQMNIYFYDIGEKLKDAIPNLGYDYKRHLPITLTPYMVLPLFATRFVDYAGGIRVPFIQPRLF